MAKWLLLSVVFVAVGSDEGAEKGAADETEECEFGWESALQCWLDTGCWGSCDLFATGLFCCSPTRYLLTLGYAAFLVICYAAAAVWAVRHCRRCDVAALAAVEATDAATQTSPHFHAPSPAAPKRARLPKAVLNTGDEVTQDSNDDLTQPSDSDSSTNEAARDAPEAPDGSWSVFHKNFIPHHSAIYDNESLNLTHRWRFGVDPDGSRHQHGAKSPHY